MNNDLKACFLKCNVTITLLEFANERNITVEKLAESLNGLQDVGLIETATKTDFSKIDAHTPITLAIYRPIVLYLNEKGGANGRAATKGV